jgi:hypothetical protein
MTSQQFADVLLAHWQNLWPLPPAERIKRIEELRLDYEYAHVLEGVSIALQEPAEPEVIAPEPSNFLQFAAAVLFIGAGMVWAIIAATPVPS